MIICPVCGNEVEGNLAKCPYCGATIYGDFTQEFKKLIIFNIEKSMPNCMQAESLLYNKTTRKLT